MNKKAALGRMLPEAAYYDVFENNVWKEDLYISGKIYLEKRSLKQQHS